MAFHALKGVKDCLHSKAKERLQVLLAHTMLIQQALCFLQQGQYEKCQSKCDQYTGTID